MDKLLPCPFCGGEAMMVKTQKCGRYVMCLTCEVQTVEYETDYIGSAYGKAIAAWNHRAQPAEPLTLEQLREMEQRGQQAGKGAAK